jgi:hypothetical protein
MRLPSFVNSISRLAKIQNSKSNGVIGVDSFHTIAIGHGPQPNGLVENSRSKELSIGRVRNGDHVCCMACQALDTLLVRQVPYFDCFII